jgi:hypothetical protein
MNSDRSTASLWRKHKGARGKSMFLQAALTAFIAAGCVWLARTWWVRAVQAPAASAEATENLREIERGAIAYFNQTHKDAAGKYLPCQFPNGWVSQADSCCSAEFDKDNDDRCDPCPVCYDHPTWKSLGLKIEGQRLYGYA